MIVCKEETNRSASRIFYSNRARPNYFDVLQNGMDIYTFKCSLMNYQIIIIASIVYTFTILHIIKIHGDFMKIVHNGDKKSPVMERVKRHDFSGPNSCATQVLQHRRKSRRCLSVGS